MKKWLKLLLILTVILSLLALSACSGNDDDGQGSGSGEGSGEGSGSGDGTDEGEGGETVSYDITFIVEGQKTVVSTKEGEIPVFEGTPEKAATEIFEYVFDGWDKELSPANGAATYTATFKEQYRYYTVTFRVDGEVYATNKIRFGKAVAFPEDKPLPKKAGLAFFGWTNKTSSVQSDITCDAMFAWGDSESIEWAYDHQLLAYKGDYDGNNNVNTSSSAFLYLAISEYNHDSPLIRARLLQHIRSFITGGCEPGFTAGPFWFYAAHSLGIMVARYTPEVWDELTAVEKEKLDVIMECYSVATAFVSDDQNNFKTGVSLTGNHAKTWNPNHRMAMTLPIVAATVYFSYGNNDGAAYVNDIFLNFDYDHYIGKFDEFGFVRAKDFWTTEGYVFEDGTQAPGAKELLISGGDAYCVRLDAGGTSNGHVLGQSYGSGVGIKGNEFSYFGIPLTNLKGIVEHMFNYNYSGGAVVSDSSKMSGGTDEDGNPLAYIMGGKTSPVEGEIGMMLEFMSSDGGGIRSTTTYCTHDLILVVEAIAALSTVDAYEPDRESELFRRMWVGNYDVIYKYNQGYHGYSLGKGYDHKESGVSYYTPWKTYWLSEYGDAIKLTRAIDYDMTGGSSDELVLQYEYNENSEQTVALPKTLTHPVGTFKGWYLNAGHTDLEYDGLKIADGKLVIPKGYVKKITLYAAYEYPAGVGIGNVIYHVGSDVKLAGSYDLHYFDIGEDAVIRLPSLDDSSGYELLGWYLDKDCEGAPLFGSITIPKAQVALREDIHIYASIYKNLYSQSATDGLKSDGFEASKTVVINGERIQSVQQVVMPDGSVILTKYADGDSSNTNGDGYWRYSGIKINSGTLTFEMTLYTEPGCNFPSSGIRLRSGTNTADFVSISAGGVKFADGTLIGKVTEEPTRFSFVIRGKEDESGAPVGGFFIDAYVDGAYAASYDYPCNKLGSTDQLTYKDITVLHWYFGVSVSGSLHVKDLSISDGVTFVPSISIDYDLGMGEGSGFVNVYDKKDTAQTVTLPTLTHEVAEFGGWYLDPEFTVTANDYLSIEGNTLTIAAGYGEQIKLYAKVEYPENLGVGEIVYNTPSAVTLGGDYSKQYYDNGKEYAITLPVITAKSGYEVIGWYLDAAQKGTCYPSGGSITLSTETVALRAPINLYPAVRKLCYDQAGGLLHEGSLSSDVKTAVIDGVTVPSITQKLDDDGSVLLTKVTDGTDNADAYWRYTSISLASGALTIDMTVYKDEELPLLLFQMRLRNSANAGDFTMTNSKGTLGFADYKPIVDLTKAGPHRVTYVVYANYDEDGAIAAGFKIDAYLNGEYAASYDYNPSLNGAPATADDISHIHIYFSKNATGSLHIKDLKITDGVVFPTAN